MPKPEAKGTAGCWPSLPRLFIPWAKGGRDQLLSVVTAGEEEAKGAHSGKDREWGADQSSEGGSERGKQKKPKEKGREGEKMGQKKQALREKKQATPCAWRVRPQVTDQMPHQGS